MLERRHLGDDGTGENVGLVQLINLRLRGLARQDAGCADKNEELGKAAERDHDRKVTSPGRVWFRVPVNYVATRPRACQCARGHRVVLSRVPVLMVPDGPRPPALSP